VSDPNDKSPVQNASRRWMTPFTTCLIWGLLIGALVRGYLAHARDPSPVVAVAIGGGVLALLILIIWVSALFTVRRWRRAQQEINDGVAALSRGQFVTANEIFTRWCEPTNNVVSALARHNLAWTLMRQGQLQEALRILSNNDSEHDRELQRLTIYPTSAADLALDHALLGNLDEAATWIATSEERAKVSANPSWSGMRVFVRAVLDCRNGRCNEAARLLDEHWAECEAELKGSELRPLRVIRAYAHAAAGPRDAGIVDGLLASSKPMYEGEYDFLGVAWPEMQTFLVAHRLTRVSSQERA
jgi:hypothetical protein